MSGHTDLSIEHIEIKGSEMSGVRPWTRKAVYERDDYTCQYCDRVFEPQELAEITVDHILPKAKGGWNHAENLVTCCQACNGLKADADIEDFAPERAKQIVEMAERRRSFSAAPESQEPSELAQKLRNALIMRDMG